MKPALLPRIRLLALASLLVGCSSTAPEDLAPLPGLWTATVSGVQIDFTLQERIAHDRTFGIDFLSVSGTGSLKVISTGESISFTLDGLHQSGVTGIWLNFIAPGTDGIGKWYGHFMGQINASGSLVGTFSGSVQNTVGPLAGVDQTVTFTRP